MIVVIAFIENSKGQLCITQRALNTPYAGYWELPGGKLEASETPTQALVREVYEELGIESLDVIHFATIEDSPCFHLFHVKDYRGTISLNAGQQAYQWLNLAEVDGYRFPERNKIFFEKWQAYLVGN